jgi:hypothetical protein
MNWTGQITSSDQGLIVDDETGRNIAVVYDPKHTSLIAAAPDLLEALQLVLHHFVPMQGNLKIEQEMIAKAHAAITRATREQA